LRTKTKATAANRRYATATMRQGTGSSDPRRRTGPHGRNCSSQLGRAGFGRAGLVALDG
jgi:hypothetical protein